MSSFVDAASMMLGPKPGTATATDTRPPQRISGTGATEATLPTAALMTGAMATMTIGAAAVRYRLTNATGLSTQVATTDPILPAYGRLDWLVEADTRVPYLEAADGSSAFEAHVWTSSPRV